MSGKRAVVPAQSFTKRPTALDKLTGAAPDHDADAPQDSDTATPPNRDTVTPSYGETSSPPHSETAQPAARGASGLEKTSFYLRPDQLDKLDELALAYRRRTGQRVGRNDLVRRLIDRCDLDSLIGEG